MSLLDHLKLQKIKRLEPAAETVYRHSHSDDINLNEQIEDNELEAYWDKVVKDIDSDPEWFKFADD